MPIYSFNQEFQLIIYSLQLKRWRVSDVGDPVDFQLKRWMVGEQWGYMPVGTNVQKNKVKFGAVVDHWESNFLILDQLPDDKFIVSCYLFHHCIVIDGVDMTMKNRHLLVIHM